MRIVSLVQPLNEWVNACRRARRTTDAWRAGRRAGGGAIVPSHLHGVSKNIAPGNRVKFSAIGENRHKQKKEFVSDLIGRVFRRRRCHTAKRKNTDANCTVNFWSFVFTRYSSYSFVRCGAKVLVRCGAKHRFDIFLKVTHRSFRHASPHLWNQLTHHSVFLLRIIHLPLSDLHLNMPV